MIIGAHTILYSPKADEVRAYFRDVLQWPSVDAGRGWLIFALPPSEVAVHPAETESRTELYLMCDSLETTMADLQSRGAEFDGPVSDQPWGRLVMLRLPPGSLIGLYEPKHPLAIDRPA